MNPVTGGRSTLLGVRFKKEVKLRTGKCVLYGIASLFFVRSKGIEYIPFFIKSISITYHFPQHQGSVAWSASTGLLTKDLQMRCDSGVTKKRGREG